jgi:signal transduction histidine kinase/PAS domain-containing protein
MPALLHIGTGDHELVEQFRESGIDVLTSAGAARPPGPYDVVVIGPEIDTPLQLARRIRTESPDAHFVFLTTTATDARLRRDLVVGRIGTQWSIAPAGAPQAAAGVVREAIAGTERRRRLRTTLGRVNRQLAHPPATTRRTIISDHFLAVVLDQLSDAVVVLDPQGLVLAWNGAAARAFGEIRRGSRFADMLPSSARDAIQAARNAPGGRAESVVLAANGVEYGLRATLLRGAAGEAIGIAAVARDITAARTEERQRQLVSDAVRVLASTLDPHAALQQLADLLVTELGDIAAIDVLEGDDVNRYAVAARTDRERALMEPLRGRNMALNRSHPSLAAILRGETMVRNAVDQAVLSGIATNDEHMAILQELHPTAFAVVPLRGGKESVGAIMVGRTTNGPFGSTDIATLQDIARQASAALHNIWSYHSASEASRLKDEFLATLSHELRTPMTSILGWAQILRLDDTPPDVIRDGLESIERSARAQAQLIDDLLDLSRMQMGKVQFQPRPFSLTAVARAAVDTVHPAAQARGVTLALDAPEDVIVNGDPDRMQQVIWNLLSNSVKFSDDGTEVRVRVTGKDGEARVTVTDRGRGIAPEFLPHVFDRFRQADSATTRRYGGLGLGLAIVKQLVELHGGTVHAASPGLGRGATFTVTLPQPSRGTQKPSALPEPIDQVPPKVLADLSGLRALIVEDDPASATTLCAILERSGAEVRTTHSVAAALESLREGIPDVLISDVAMPDDDGLALIRAVRGRLRIGAERLPAIALTAFHDVDLRVALLGAGFQRFMTKPVDAHTLATVVAALAGR